jgi:hypothetical protein
MLQTKTSEARARPPRSQSYPPEPEARSTSPSVLPHLSQHRTPSLQADPALIDAKNRPSLLAFDVDLKWFNPDHDLIVSIVDPKATLLMHSDQSIPRCTLRKAPKTLKI